MILNPNAKEWKPPPDKKKENNFQEPVSPITNKHQPIERPNDEHIRNTYCRIIDSYRVRLELVYRETGNYREQSVYNCDYLRKFENKDATCADIDKAFENVVDDGYHSQLYAKDFRGYVRRGICYKEGCFPNWLTERDDLIPIVYMAITDNVHNITKRLYVAEGEGLDPDISDGTKQSSYQFYCKDGKGNEVQLSTDLLDLAKSVSGPIVDYDHSECESWSVSTWSHYEGDDVRDEVLSDHEYWTRTHYPNELEKSRAGNGWWTFYEVHKINGGAWKYQRYPDVTKLHLKLTRSTSLVGLHHVFPNLTALVIDYCEHPGGIRERGDHFCRTSSGKSGYLDYFELEKFASKLTHLEICLDAHAFSEKIDPRPDLNFLVNLSTYRVEWGVPTKVRKEEEQYYPLYLYYAPARDIVKMKYKQSKFFTRHEWEDFCLKKGLSDDGSRKCKMGKWEQPLEACIVSNLSFDIPSDEQLLKSRPPAKCNSNLGEWIKKIRDTFRSIEEERERLDEVAPYCFPGARPCHSMEWCGVPEHEKYVGLLEKLYDQQRPLAIAGGDAGLPDWAKDFRIWLTGCPL